MIFNLVHSAMAAADTGLTNGLASSSTIIEENAPVIMGFITSTWGKALLIGLLVAALSLGSAMIIGAVFRRKKGRK